MSNKKKEEISRNVVFPCKLSYQEQYPTTSFYKTPEYIKKYRERNLS